MLLQYRHIRTLHLSSSPLSSYANLSVYLLKSYNSGREQAGWGEGGGGWGGGGVCVCVGVGSAKVGGISLLSLSIFNTNRFLTCAIMHRQATRMRHILLSSFRGDNLRLLLRAFAHKPVSKLLTTTSRKISIRQKRQTRGSFFFFVSWCLKPRVLLPP